MENQPTIRQIYFYGNGGSLFGIYVVNAILTIITLGLYYPWAKAATLRYLYQETELENSRFTFHGTGKEMFLGFIKAVAIFAAFYGFLLYAIFTQEPTLILTAVGVFYAGLLVLIPIAIHGSMKYRMSRSSYRGIHFGYRGELMSLLQIFISGFFLSILTLGIYSAWFAINVRKYVLENVRFGSIKFHYTGKGSEFLLLVLKGYFLTLLTLGIYMFWFAKDMFNYYIDNIKLEQDGRIIELRSTATGGGYFGLIVVNLLIIVFSLGLATPWAIVRTLEFVFSNVLIEGELDLDAIEQTEKAYNDATGEDVADMMDIGLV